MARKRYRVLCRCIWRILAGDIEQRCPANQIDTTPSMEGILQLQIVFHGNMTSADPG